MNDKIDQIKKAAISENLKNFLLTMINDCDKIEERKTAEFFKDKKEEATKLFQDKELEIALIKNI